jgi:TolB-like protein
VVRVAAAYLVSSWLLIEMADIMFPAFGFPPNAMKWMIGALGLGLIPMLLFSWVYELTPEGLVRDGGPDRENPENRKTGRRLDQVTIMMILLALGVVAIERFVLPQRVLPDPVVVEVPSGEVRQVVVQVPAMPIPDGPSIAVLAFDNMSPDPENAYFAEGISEEILNILAGIEGLKVASRTSAFNFKDSDTSIPDIARQLGVAHVLEGSVRRAGMRVRITAQLIDASNDQHLWSDSFDRELDDIFAVQEEIANAISAALGEALGLQVGSVSVRAPTENLEAYELYLRGRQLFYQRGGSLRPALEHLRNATDRDPEFAEAWATLAAAYAVAPSYLAEYEEAESNRMAEESAYRAIELDGSMGLPHAVLGLSSLDEGDVIEARHHFEAALERTPDDAMTNMWMGLAFVSVGDPRAALPYIQRSLETDPLIGITNAWMAGVMHALGRLDEARFHAQRSIDLQFPVGYSFLSTDAYLSGDRESAARYQRQFLDWNRWNVAPSEEASYNRRAEALAAAIIDPSLFDPELSDLRVAWMAGQPGAGLRVAHRDGWGSAEAGTVWTPGAEDLAEDPYYLVIAEERGYIAYWERYGYPEGCERVTGPEGGHLDCSARREGLR